MPNKGSRSGGKLPPYLRVVPPPTQNEDFSLWSWMQARLVPHESLEEGRRNRAYLIRYFLTIHPTLGTMDQREAITKERILQILQERGAILHMDCLDTVQLRTAYDRLLQLFHHRSPELAEQKRQRQELEERTRSLARFLRDQATNPISRTELIQRLRHIGVDVRNHTLLRILINEINTQQDFTDGTVAFLCPRILGLPDPFDVQAPFYMLVEHNGPLPIQVVRLLRLFNA